MEQPNIKEVIEKNLVAKTNEIIPAGQEWRVAQLLKSEILVKAGAKLTVTEMAAKNKIIVEEGGELEIIGQDLKNEIIGGGKEEKKEALSEKSPEINSQSVKTDKEIWNDMITPTQIDIDYINKTLNLSEETVDKLEKLEIAVGQMFNEKILDNLRVEGVINEKQSEIISQKIAQLKNDLVKVIFNEASTIQSDDLITLASEHRKFKNYLETGDTNILISPELAKIQAKGPEEPLTKEEIVKLADYLKTVTILNNIRAGQAK